MLIPPFPWLQYHLPEGMSADSALVLSEQARKQKAETPPPKAEYFLYPDI